MPTEMNNKYLLLAIDKPGRNIDQALNILRSAIREAVYLDRIPVIGTFSINTSHDSSSVLENTSYSRHVDLHKTQICKIENGDITQIEKPFDYIDAQDFNLNTYPNSQVLSIDDDKAISAQQNNQYKIIIRKITTNKFTGNYPDILVRFFASSEVERVTDIVLKTMGTSLESVKKLLSSVHRAGFSANQDLFQAKVPQHPAYYACMHIPYSKDPTPAQIYSAKPRQIKKIFARLRMHSRAVYIMSDIHNPNYFNFLKKPCDIYQYADFPELKKLASNDNAMLSSVEKNILQYAAIKMIPFEDLSGLPIIYNNSSHKIPQRYKLRAWRQTLSNFARRV